MQFGTLPWTSRLRGWRGAPIGAAPSGLNQRGVSMQKKLLTMAVAGALAGPGLALAQSSVEVYGTVYPTFGHAKYGEGFTARNTSATATAGPSMLKFDGQAPASNFGGRGRGGVGGRVTRWFP